jgi:transposase
MKTQRKIISTLFFSILAFGIISAQPANSNDQIKNSLNKIFELSKADDYDACAKFIVYSGTDKKRNLVDTYNMQERSEAKDVKRICKKIKALLDITDKYDFKNLTTETIKDKNIYIQMIDFKSSGQQLTTKFEFIKVGDKYLLLSVK